MTCDIDIYTSHYNWLKVICIFKIPVFNTDINVIY